MLRTLQLYVSGLSWDIEIKKTAFESSSKIITKLLQSFFLAQVNNEVTTGQKVNFEKKMFSTITSFISKIEQRFWQHLVCLIKTRWNIYNVTLKGQGQIWPHVKVGHEVTQVGHIIYQPTRIYETNALTSISRLYLLLIASYWQKKAGDLEWPHLTFKRVSDQKFHLKYQEMILMKRLGSIIFNQLIHETEYIYGPLT